MAIAYTVVAGDFLTSIAKKFGIADWRTIYFDPSNAAFRAKRPNPNHIFAGDVIMIPVASPSSSPSTSPPPPLTITPVPPPPLFLRLRSTVTGTPIATSGPVRVVGGDHLEVRLANRMPQNTDVEVSVLAIGASFHLKDHKLVSLTSFRSGTAAFVTLDTPPPAVTWEVTVKIVTTASVTIPPPIPVPLPLPPIAVTPPGVVSWEIWLS